MGVAMPPFMSDINLCKQSKNIANTSNNKINICYTQLKYKMYS